METIDQKVKKVIEREKAKLSKSGVDSTGCTLYPIDESIKPVFKLAPKDTIGKSIYFNTVRR